MSTITLKSGIYFPYLIRFNFEQLKFKFKISETDPYSQEENIQLL